jgi:hypothetical protein
MSRHDVSPEVLLSFVSRASRHRPTPLDPAPARRLRRLLEAGLWGYFLLIPILALAITALLVTLAIHAEGLWKGIFGVLLVVQVLGMLVATFAGWGSQVVVPLLAVMGDSLGVFGWLFTGLRWVSRRVLRFFVPWWAGLVFEVAEVEREKNALAEGEASEWWVEREEAPQLFEFLETVAGALGREPWPYVLATKGGNFVARSDVAGNRIFEFPWSALQSLSSEEFLAAVLTASWYELEPAQVELVRSRELLANFEMRLDELEVNGVVRYADLGWWELVALERLGKRGVARIESQHETQARRQTAEVMGPGQPATPSAR